MRAIMKDAEPQSLLTHRKTSHCDYDNYAYKDELRNALVTEQHGLCCYCMGRISPDSNTMKIEHWQCQTTYPNQQLTYRNLLGACKGGEGQPFHSQHCDTRKGDDEILWNPADPTHSIETRIRYEPNGTIRSNNKTFDNQLNQILNLNLPILKANRSRVLDAVLEWWKRKGGGRKGRPMNRDDFVRKRNQYASGVGKLQPYCQVTVWWLEQRIARMKA